MMEFLTEAFQGGATYLLILITALAFLECMFGIGLFVSGIFLLSTSTAFYLGGDYPLWQITLAAFLGAIVGDHAGYFIGRYSGPTLWRHRVILRHEEKARKVQGWLQTSAPLTICLGRLIPAVRSLTPVIAGLSDVPPRRFVLIDLLACTLWATGLSLLVSGIATF